MMMQTGFSKTGKHSPFVDQAFVIKNLPTNCCEGRGFTLVRRRVVDPLQQEALPFLAGSEGISKYTYNTYEPYSTPTHPYLLPPVDPPTLNLTLNIIPLCMSSHSPCPFPFDFSVLGTQ